MDGRIQQKIAPITSSNTYDFNQQKVDDKQTSSPSKIDFKSLLLNSNADIAAKRANQKNGDLSSAGSYEEFLDQLNAQAKNAESPKTKLDKDDFLKLFVTQLQNQDPLKPKDGTEMASQLAQFNSLEQMMNVNTTLQRIEEADASGRMHQLIDYIDKEIVLHDGRSKLENGKVVDTFAEFKFPVLDSQLEIRDSNGEVVATKAFGPHTAGLHKIEWDGKNQKGEKLTDGLYTFSVKGVGQGGSEIEGSVRTAVKVTGVNLKDKNASLHTKLGKISVNDIAEIGVAGFNRPQTEPKEAPIETAKKPIRSTTPSAEEETNPKLKTML